ncbi:MAG: trypsin-like peptidase domain-containing protein [Clostridia bacterium]|nr:trypsin-like peptidase domain-containing protein [Clostridia bacterium]
MNDFENNSINNSQDEIKENSAPQNNEAPATYSSTYIPSNNGYTHTTENVRYMQQNNMYSPYSDARREQPKKNNSKAGIIAIAVCAFVVVALTFSGIGFLVATSHMAGNDAPNFIIEDTNGGTEPETNHPQTDANTENKQDITATINKNDSEPAKENSGKVGELMTKSQVAKLVRDSVVEITTEQVVNGNSFYQYVQSGAGSGVIIAKEGIVITNNHVINSANKVIVRLTNGNEYEAEILGSDASSDIAILKINPNEELTTATLGSSANLSLAEEIIVIGNPLGELGGTVTNGIISALAREITIDGENMTLIQTNAAVNPGNSGGGMFNLYGELVGIINAKSSGSDVEGLGFAIPIDTAYNISLQLMDYGYVKGRIDHGLELIDIRDLFTAASYRVNSLGVYVAESKYSDDIKSGDRIASINGTEVSTSAGVKAALSGCAVGDVVDVTVVRGGRLIDVKLTLREYVPEGVNEVTFD